MWKYESPIGALYIKMLPNGRYGLFYANILWDHSNTPENEAGNVYHHATGLYEWDSLDGQVLDCPCDLSGWEVI